jgi:ribA/ribD-fused uncharacterized protein
LTTPPITRFTGRYGFLSNFHPSPLEWMGLAVPTVEHGFQVAKTLDPATRLRIAGAPSPGQAKRLGRGVELRPDWEIAKTAVMAALLVQKFTRHPLLADKLLRTGDAVLVEGNSWGDKFWGICEGSGCNELGRQLMAVRALLQGLASPAAAA